MLDCEVSLAKENANATTYSRAKVPFTHLPGYLTSAWKHRKRKSYANSALSGLRKGVSPELGSTCLLCIGMSNPWTCSMIHIFGWKRCAQLNKEDMVVLYS